MVEAGNGDPPRIVDTHHHLWDLRQHRYPWLTTNIEPKPYGDYADIRRDYLIGDFLADIAATNVRLSVHLNAGIDQRDSLKETAWLQAIADDTTRSRGFPHGIVSAVDLLGDDVEAEIEAHCRHPNMRGIRQILSGAITAGHPDPSTAPDWLANLRLLARYGLSLDMQVHPAQLQATAATARAIEPVTLVVDHAGMLNYQDPELLAVWRAGIRTLAEVPTVVMKISAFMIYDLHWTAAGVRPFIDEMVDVFGPDRCCFGSNFPVDRLSKSYAGLWRALAQATAQYGPDERDRMFFRNAVAIYRLRDGG